MRRLKCFLCRKQDHFWPACTKLKSWDIKKKLSHPRQNTNGNEGNANAVSSTKLSSGNDSNENSNDNVTFSRTDSPTRVITTNSDSEGIACCGIRSTICRLDEKFILLTNVLYVPGLRHTIYSVQQHRRYPNCSFASTCVGSFLCFPCFSIPFDNKHQKLIKIEFYHRPPENLLPHNFIGSELADTSRLEHDYTRLDRLTMTSEAEVSDISGDENETTLFSSASAFNTSIRTKLNSDTNIAHMLVC